MITTTTGSIKLWIWGNLKKKKCEKREMEGLTLKENLMLRF